MRLLLADETVRCGEPSLSEALAAIMPEEDYLYLLYGCESVEKLKRIGIALPCCWKGERWAAVQSKILDGKVSSGDVAWEQRRSNLE